MTWKIKIDRPSTTTSWCIKNVFFCIMSKILIIFSWIVDVYLIHFFSLIKNYTSHLLLFTDTLYVKVWETTLYWYIVCQGMGDYSLLIHCMSRYGRLLCTDTLYVKVWETTLYWYIVCQGMGDLKKPYYRSNDWFIVFNATFSYIMATRFSGGRNRSTWREPPTMGKQLVNFITCGHESSSLFFVIYKADVSDPTCISWIFNDIIIQLYIIVYNHTPYRCNYHYKQLMQKIMHRSYSTFYWYLCLLSILWYVPEDKTIYSHVLFNRHVKYEDTRT
jgi:hypothetical protein